MPPTQAPALPTTAHSHFTQEAFTREVCPICGIALPRHGGGPVSGYCVMGFHPDCSDNHENTGTCPCPCHSVFDEDDEE